MINKTLKNRFVLCTKPKSELKELERLTGLGKNRNLKVEYKTITMLDINKNPDIPWNWNAISSHPNLTMKNILDNPDKPWDRQYISGNTFIKDKEEFQVKMYREHLAAGLIQNAYKNALVNPNCRLGINRIERDMVFAGI